MSGARAPWWMYILAAAFLGCWGLQVYTASPFYDGPGPIGIFRDFKSSSNVVERVVPNSIAERTGLRAGDRIVAVDGFPTPGIVDFDIRTLSFEVGRPVLLEVEREGKRIQFIVTLELRSGNALAWQGWLLAAGNLFTLTLAFVVAFRRPFDLVARMGGWFLATAAISIFPPISGFAAAFRHLPLPIGALLWLAVASEGVFPAILFTFFAVFPRTLFRWRWVWWLVWLPAVLVAVPQFLTALATVYQTTLPQARFELSVAANLAFRGCYMLAGLTVLVVNYRRLTDVNERRRVRVLVIGALVGWVAIGLFFTLLVVGWGQALVNYGPFITTALIFLFLTFPVSFSYAILRHRVFDLGLIIRQGLQYALARGVLLTAVPALSLLLLGDLLLHGQQPLLDILRARGWIYVFLGGLAAIAYMQRQSWLETLDRRFFRERYDAQRLLREVVAEVREARSFEQVAPRATSRIEAALHPEFVALLVREPHEPIYRCLALAPSDHALPALPAESKLMSLVRLMGKPLQVPQSGSSWLGDQLPHEETDFLRQARIEFMVPIAVAADRTEALLALGLKRSEEPYAREDQDLLVAVAASLALLLEKPRAAVGARSDAFEECPQCGTCYDSGSTHCAQEGKRLMPVILPRLLEGRYLLQQRLGRGGMGTVYAASDAELERRVAVKVIRDELVGSQEAAERFRREAKACAAFTHPNVVTVYDFGVAAGTRAFLVMELLEGTSLREELRQRKRLTAPRTLDILRGVTAAVEAAHRRQLIHRDLKPENIFLARNDAAEVSKVLDFGVAKFVPTDTQMTLDGDTGAGILMGTTNYMAPEQLNGEPVGVSWDLWALGVTAYEMLTGAHPFSGRTHAEWLAAIRSGRFAPVNAHVPDASPRWQEFFARAFAPDPQRRLGSATAFYSELENARKSTA